jgi:hypothetical protein
MLPDVSWRVVPPLLAFVCSVIAVIRDARGRTKRFAVSTFDYSTLPPSDAADLKMIAGCLRDLVRRAIPLVIEIGDYLKSAKARLPHGQFGKFCREAAGIEIRSAENYLALADLAKVYPPSELAKLPAGAAYQLAAKTAPAQVVEEVMSEVRAGRVPGFNDVKRRIAAGKAGEAPPPVLDIDDLADRLLDALDARDVGEIERFLRTGKKAMIAVFCERLQQGLEQRHAKPAAVAMLPRNEL